MAVGAFVLAGWLFEVRALMQVVPGAIAMVPNTAVSFLLVGLSLWLQAGRKADSSLKVSRVAAAATGLLGLTELAQYVSRTDFGIDELLFRDPTGLTSVFPGRMAVSTALGFMAIAGALLISGLPRARWLSEALALVPGLLGLLSLAGYAYGVRSLYWIGTFKGMAIHTALAFILLTVGTLLAHPDGPISRLLLSESIGGLMVRRLLPFAIVIPVVLGWMERKGRQAELYQSDFGVALLVVASIVLIGIVVGWQGAALERIDRARFEATREMERALESLARREGRFRSLIENAQDVITILDARGTIGYMSPAAESILGRPPEEFVGKSVFDFLHPDDTAVAHAAIGRVMENPESVRTWLIRLRHANGSWRTMEVIGKLLAGEGSPQIVANSRDVTESHALEEQLRQSQKMEAVGRLAGGIAHDFNNLLTVIGGYGELLLTSIPRGHPNREPLEAIVAAGERAASLTRQLLAFSRKQVLVPEVLDLNAIVARMDKMLGRLIGEDVNLFTKLDPSAGNVRADPSQLEQVIMNLAVNARDAMPRGGKLTIETANAELGEAYAQRHAAVATGPHVMLAVSDTGVGMDAETQGRIFEPFFTTKERGKGTGLGLSTVFGIVKQSGGSIWVYSEPGKGSTFKIYLPRVEEAPMPRETPSGINPSIQGTETILLVEDEASIRTLARKVLESAGHRVVEAKSGPDALELVRGSGDPIHLLLTDLVMPEMAGTELASRLLESRPELRILYMSGYTDDAVVRHGLLDHRHHFLPKPFTPSVLAAKVREVLDAPREAGPAGAASRGTQ